MTNLQTCPPGGISPTTPPPSPSPSPSPSSCGNCVFPFIMNNRIHDRCTTILGTNPLCATTSNYDQDGQFEWCTDSTCPGVAPPTETMTVSPGNEVGSCYCGIPNRANNKIVGGNPTEIGEYPWQVALLYKGENLATQGCGGTLVSDKYVITAAHCTEGRPPANLTIRIGDTILDTEEEVEAFTVQVSRIANHPQYSFPEIGIPAYDIAVVELASSISLTAFPNIKPACLPAAGALFTGPATVTGWGNVNFESYQNSWLHEVDVEIFADGDCGNWGDLTDDMICAGVREGGKDICQGDSGGPLVAADPSQNNRMTLAGVVSFTNRGCGDPGFPGGYSEVSHNIDWLLGEMTNFQSCLPGPPSPTSPTPNPPSPSPTPPSSGCGNCLGFPWIYHNRIHDRCTTIYGDNPWCSTSNGWEYCTDPSCPGVAPPTEVMTVSPGNEVGSCYCGIPNKRRNNRIVGGSPTEVGELPWQVALIFGRAHNLWLQGCGGTLVGDKYVITAAHCTDLKSPSDIFVQIGDTTLDTEKEVTSFTIAVKRIIEHPNYGSPKNFSNDIAILELATKIPLNQYPNIKPACLPAAGALFPGNAIVSGWGTVASGSFSNSWLHEVNVTVFADGNCGSMNSQMSEDMMCAGLMGGGKDSCQGDSGGPLVVADPAQNNRMTLAGVVSWGFGCGDADSLGIYSEVSHNINWAKSQMQDLVTCGPDGVMPTTTTPPAPICNENTKLAFKTIQKLKRIRTWQICRNKCNNKDGCAYWSFKDNRNEKRKLCLLRAIDYKNKNGYDSGAKYCI